jgi:hypothetical protein
MSTTTQAPRFGIAREDALHAIANVPRTSSGSSTSRGFRGHVRPTLFIGPPRQRGGALLEVMVELVEPRDIHVFHVMPARPKHLERMEDRT